LYVREGTIQGDAAAVALATLLAVVRPGRAHEGAVTPGKYYWQAHYYTGGDTAVCWSPIGSFVVK
jgi:hypothetical protein